MAKVIQFLILGLLIIHISESNASVENTSWKSFIKPNMTLSQFVDVAIEAEANNDRSFNTIKLVKLFNSVDKDGNLKINDYEILSMK
jgi:hypothetical protein